MAEDPQRCPTLRKAKKKRRVPKAEGDHSACLVLQDDGSSNLDSPSGTRIASDEQGSSCPDIEDLTERCDENSVLLKTSIRRRRGKAKEAEQEASSFPGSVLVGLKLDKYQEILDAWSDKGPFWLGGQHPRPQLVPDKDLSPPELWTMWTVPELNPEDSTWRRREESVMRYKEKRQSRLFSNRIRYEVRRLNAQTRPRNKGRFVKQND